MKDEELAKLNYTILTFLEKELRPDGKTNIALLQTGSARTLPETYAGIPGEDIVIIFIVTTQEVESRTSKYFKM